jgi:CheY-like chemotaxis protein
MEKVKCIGLLRMEGHERPLPVHVSLSMHAAEGGQHLKWYGDCHLCDPRDAGTVAAQAGYHANILLGDGRKARVLVTEASQDRMGFVGEEPLAQSAPPLEGEGCDVLIIEDEMPVAKVLEKYLQVAGYSTRVCLDGASAVLALTEMRPRLLLLDLMLPDLRGWDLLVTLRSHPLLKDVPVVVLSAIDEGRGELHFHGHEPDAYLRKPSDVHKVVERVQEFIGPAE